MAGMGAASRLAHEGRPAILSDDANTYPGGHTASFAPGGWVFDDGPHVSFTKDERVQGILADAVDGAFERSRSTSTTTGRATGFTHPAQVNLHGLPIELIVKIILDFVEAHRNEDVKVENYEEWCHAAFGRTFAETFPLTYARKYHTTTADKLTTDWLGPRMYRPNLEEIFRGALAAAPTTDVHYVTHFRYPSYGGYPPTSGSGRRGRHSLGHELVGVDPRAREARFANGVVVPYDRLISSIPLPELVPLIDGAPAAIRRRRPASPSRASRWSTSASTGRTSPMPTSRTSTTRTSSSHG